MKIIDLRSDTVTLPSPEMRKAMAGARVGDDVYKEDPTVNELEALGADLTGKKASLFVASGTQSNLIALLCHCGRGDEYIVGMHAHAYKYEAGGAAVLGSIQPQPLVAQEDGTLDLTEVEKFIKPDDFHFARSRLLCLENTHNGLALPHEYFARAADFCKSRKLALHLDGARLFNAAAYTKYDAKEIAAHFDSVSICLSKGLGAPVGSLLCGTKEMIEKAKRWRKILGGGMRQAGILAAAGIYSLTHNISRLKEDHENCRLLAKELMSIDELKVEYPLNQTNMLFVTFPEGSEEIDRELQQYGIIVPPGKRKRLVTHLDIQREDIKLVGKKIKNTL